MKEGIEMNSKIDFLEGNTRKSLLKMVIPLLCAMILTMAYNLVDSLWVGNILGETGYAALTNSTAIVLILSAIAMGASNGIAILVSQAVGAGEKDKSNRIITTLLILSTVFSILITLLLEVLLKPILAWMNTPTELVNLAYEYLSIYLIGYAAIYLYMQYTAIFRSFGDSLFQMKGMLITTIFNAVLDPILIHLMGLKGAAWATVLSELLCLLYAIAYNRSKKMFVIKLNDFTFDSILPILKDAIPSALQSCMPAISSATMLLLVTKYGISTIAAYGVTNKLEIILFYPAMAMNMGLTTIVGQCIGAKRIDRVRDYMKCGLLIGSIFTAVLSVGIIVFSRQLTGLFIDSSDAATVVQGFFQIVSIGYVLYMITSCYLGELSGLGKPELSMALMFVYYIVVRIPVAIILANNIFGLQGIWTAILISHIVAAILASLIGHHMMNKKEKLKISINQY